MGRNINLRLHDDDEPRLREVARAAGAVSPSGIDRGEPSISALLRAIASGELVVARRGEVLPEAGV